MRPDRVVGHLISASSLARFPRRWPKLLPIGPGSRNCGRCAGGAESPPRVGDLALPRHAYRPQGQQESSPPPAQWGFAAVTDALCGFELLSCPRLAGLRTGEFPAAGHGGPGLGCRGSFCRRSTRAKPRRGSSLRTLAGCGQRRAGPSSASWLTTTRRRLGGEDEARIFTRNELPLSGMSQVQVCSHGTLTPLSSCRTPPSRGPKHHPICQTQVSDPAVAPPIQPPSRAGLRSLSVRASANGDLGAMTPRSGAVPAATHYARSTQRKERMKDTIRNTEANSTGQPMPTPIPCMAAGR